MGGREYLGAVEGGKLVDEIVSGEICLVRVWFDMRSIFGWGFDVSV